ncbi:DUF99 family protein [Candidatus Woesearchaeota archaeon]|nr:DUF99 family protein [Candidatus Woesearchaeota archaeon]
MKDEIRVIGIDDAPFDKFKGGDVLVVATMFRGGSWLDGVLSTRVRVDGRNATDKLIRMITSCSFLPQLQCIILDGIALGGFNIVDVQKLHRQTGIPVMTVIRRMPDLKAIKATLRKLGKQRKYRLLEKAGPVHKKGKIYYQAAGLSPEDAEKVLQVTCTRSLLPEPIRAAHIIAAGIVKGESRGRA